MVAMMNVGHLRVLGLKPLEACSRNRWDRSTTPLRTSWSGDGYKRLACAVPSRPYKP